MAKGKAGAKAEAKAGAKAASAPVWDAHSRNGPNHSDGRLWLYLLLAERMVSDLSVRTLMMGSFVHLVVLWGVYVVGRERMYLEEGFFSLSGVLVWRVSSSA